MAAHLCAVPTTTSSRSARPLPLRVDSDAQIEDCIGDDSVIVAPQALYLAFGSPQAFHDARRRHEQVLRIAALARGISRPWRPLRYSDFYSEPDRDRESIRTVIRTFSRVSLCPKGELWSLVYIPSLGRGATKEDAKPKLEEAQKTLILGDLQGRVGVGLLELRSNDNDEKTLLVTQLWLLECRR